MTREQSLITCGNIKKLALNLDTQRCYAKHEGNEKTADLLNKQVLELWAMYFELQEYVWNPVAA